MTGQALCGTVVLLLRSILFFLYKYNQLAFIPYVEWKARYVEHSKTDPVWEILSASKS